MWSMYKGILFGLKKEVLSFATTCWCSLYMVHTNPLSVMVGRTSLATECCSVSPGGWGEGGETSVKGHKPSVIK